LIFISTIKTTCTKEHSSAVPLLVFIECFHAGAAGTRLFRMRNRWYMKHDFSAAIKKISDLFLRSRDALLNYQRRANAVKAQSSVTGPLHLPLGCIYLYKYIWVSDIRTGNNIQLLKQFSVLHVYGGHNWPNVNEYYKQMIRWQPRSLTWSISKTYKY
jgi:hypothetical protein